MPIYRYHCDACDTDQEIRQGFHDDDLSACPLCGVEGKFRRVLLPTGIIFKGSGFYVTDNKGGKNPAAPGATDHRHENGASSKPADEKKPEAKTKTKPETTPAKSD